MGFGGVKGEKLGNPDANVKTKGWKDHPTGKIAPAQSLKEIHGVGKTLDATKTRTILTKDLE